jgi:hypothetical protein
MVTLLQAVGLEQITPQYIYFDICWNEQMQQRTRFYDQLRSL